MRRGACCLADDLNDVLLLLLPAGRDRVEMGPAKPAAVQMKDRPTKPRNTVMFGEEEGTKPSFEGR